jgi:hypothetical protein
MTIQSNIGLILFEKVSIYLTINRTDGIRKRSAGLVIWLEINLYKILLHVFQTTAKQRVEMRQGI